ncbi:hypothetical protein EF888_11075 [Silicimonas algicola]|uniref:Rhamnosyltransferase n=1 Tax=Silicimonas algicola TaxID=1826607 RepID=A0A316FSU5_9RHOB|nr:hypothetical protein [Silicimonas algicola]AZQ67626.1 hypothetical protein EF888_11075 [Silicimonas algicola]PWK51659.1 hypothetical protein C8D95_1172 [Silicimonas algicola]
MKLGIIVVYVFGDEMQPMFDVHIDRIRSHTRTPFRIFAAAHKLPPAQRAHVNAVQEISLPHLNVPEEVLSKGTRAEHSHCLAQLADIAFEDGCTHVISMHLDSFPLKDGWEDAFIVPIESGEAVVTSIVPNGYSAGLCWRRDFHLEHRPPMLVKQSDRAGSEFQSFVEEHPKYDYVETGLGVIYTAWRLGLGWRRIGTDEERKIYGGILFHMVGATFRTLVDVQPIRDTPAARILWPIAHHIVRLLPKRAGQRVRSLFVDFDRTTRDGSPRSKAAENAALMADPDSYLAELRRRYRGEEVLI